MDVDLSRLPTGSAGWLALSSYAVSLGDLSELDYLELKGNLKFSSSRDRKRSAVVIARAILGMANRMPDDALKHLSGAGVIFIGIEQGAVVGVEQVDGAVLRDAIQPYLGSDGPKWDHQFVVHSECLILAVIVDPPKWGDSIRTCRKDFSDDTTKLVVRDGEVFVRIPGKTRAANSHEVSQLEKRRLRAPHTDAQLRVSYAGSFDRVSTDNIHGLWKEQIDDVADRLLDGLPDPKPIGMYGVNLGSLLGSTGDWEDRRGEEGFRVEVEKWREDCRAEFEAVTDEFLRYTLVQGELVIVNESDRYLEMVHASVQLPPRVRVLLASDTSYCDHGGRYFQALQLFPKRPVKYGQHYGYDFVGPDASSMVLRPQAAAKPGLAVTTGSEGCLVTWVVGDLPPRARIPSGDGLAIFVDDGGIHDHAVNAPEIGHYCMLSSFETKWEVTARGVDHVFTDTLRMECRQDPGVVLTWSHRAESS